MYEAREHTWVPKAVGGFRLLAISTNVEIDPRTSTIEKMLQETSVGHTRQ